MLHGPWVQQLAALEAARAQGAVPVLVQQRRQRRLSPAAATLAGADNHFVANLAHVELAFDPRAGRLPGTGLNWGQIPINRQSKQAPQASARCLTATSPPTEPAITR